MPSAALRNAVILLLAASLVPFAATTLIHSLGAIGSEQELDYGESIVYSHALRLVHGQALYQPLDRPPYTVVAYTPLFYVVGAALRLVFGPGFVAGRVLSLVSGAAVISLVGLLGAALARRVWVSALAALMMLALGFPGPVSWLALYRVDTLGVAFALASVAVLHRSNRSTSVVVAATLAALAIVTKQTLFAAAVAGTLWLWTCTWRRAVLFASVSFGLPAAAALVLQAATRGAFAQNTIAANLNPLDSTSFETLAAVVAVTLGLPVVLAAMATLRLRPGRLIVWYWFATALSLLGLLKIGAGRNYWIEFGAATCVLAALGIAHRTTSFSAITGIFAAFMVLLVAQVPGRPALPAADDPAFDRLVAEVRAEPSQVLALPLDVVALAERPIVLEPLIYSIFYEAEMWDPAPLLDRICTGDVRLLVTNRPLDSPPDYAGQPFWPAPVLDALRGRMRLRETLGGRYVYACTD